mmetsp:Transcript_31065/g.53101  ORF Transcript_31065/g.53101 Transcript_31065/m.53101 type:complete len:102 (-) Transcript_31065:78-383(-)|eukprot:CAMPEP_0183712228 /NCGR_PEP_ID=MMETSP0737-20130205/7411_1 /TAXON_ID=385413 /ORGANISM="Thalassiosira miniscula, Strain CCMP1093" /LENGTH=101 /DNA_ID=CAMNT_0025940807 /DNA_START=596 /DNA_END=901 /DNA_ORIENTATION=+
MALSAFSMAISRSSSVMSASLDAESVVDVDESSRPRPADAALVKWDGCGANPWMGDMAQNNAQMAVRTFVAIEIILYRRSVYCGICYDKQRALRSKLNKTM